MSQIKVRLPKKLRKAITPHLKIRGYRVIEAYVDETEYSVTKKSGLKELRKFLEVDGSSSVCDCYCKIKIGNSSITKFLFEYKDSHHRKSPETAKKQLEKTQALLKKKRKINIDYAVMCRISMEPPFETRSNSQFPFKEIFLKMTKKTVCLEGTKIPLLSC